MEALKQAGLTLLVSVVLPALALLLAAALNALRKKLEAQTGESKLAQVGARVSIFAEAIVRDLEANMRPELALATADGKLTPEEQERIKLKALEHLKASLGTRGLAELQAVLGIAAGQLGVFLSGIIEGAVERMKVGQTLAQPAELASTQAGLVVDSTGHVVPPGPPMPLGSP